MGCDKGSAGLVWFEMRWRMRFGGKGVENGML